MRFYKVRWHRMAAAIVIVGVGGYILGAGDPGWTMWLRGFLAATFLDVFLTFFDPAPTPEVKDKADA